MTRAGIEHLDNLPAWRRAYPMVYVEDLADLTLAEDDHHHLSRSLRVANGDPISVSDAAGDWLPALFGAVAEAIAQRQSEPPPAWPATVAFSPVKGQKTESTVQKLTELGVDHIVPLVTDRSVVRWDERRSTRQRQRWQRVIREAGMQSRSVRLPSFDDAQTVDAFVAAFPHAALADPAGEQTLNGLRTIMIGPEGGWSDRERAGRPLVSLPGGVLRAETASVVAGAMLIHRRS